MNMGQLLAGAIGGMGSQMWILIVLAVGFAVLKSSVKRPKRKKSGRARAVTKPPVPTKTQEEIDYERRLDGVAGELKVRRLLERWYQFSLHDSYLPGRNGLTQVDHIVLVEGAIVVIETKNYAGMIFGDPKGRSWTQVLAGGNVHHPFMNPIHQNAGHVSAVVKATGNRVPVLNVVVFVGTATFARDMPEGVMELADLEKYLGTMSFLHPREAHTLDAWSVLCGATLEKPKAELAAAHRATLAKRLACPKAPESRRA